jgi:predicted DCC family thiol-disulfide oxidoreductase YuxK
VRGFACHDCCQPRGALLPHHFTLTADRSRLAVYFLCHCSVGLPRPGVTRRTALWSSDFPLPPALRHPTRTRGTTVTDSSGHLVNCNHQFYRVNGVSGSARLQLIDVPPLPYTIVLFDGVCGLCNWSIDFLIKRDKNAALRFAPLQSALAQALIREHNIDPHDLSTAVVIDRSQAHVRSDAALCALQRLGGGWRVLAAIAALVPRMLRDIVYNSVARNRYRWFGQRQTCRVPTFAERERFLE